LQDFLPIFISILLFVSFRSVNPLILVYRLSPYTRIFLIVALVKVIYILVAQPVADWGDTWISAQYSLESGIPRIMLKGAAPLFFLAVVFEFINMLNNKKRSIWYLSIGVALIVLGGSRALIAATLVPSFFVLISIFKFRSSKVRIKVIFTLGLLSATIALVTGSSFRLSDPEISGDFAQVGVDSVSAAYRMLETTSAIESVQNKYIGNGLGATFYSIGSGAESSDGEGVYIHSFPVWVYVKFGLFGLIFSCVAFMIFALKYLINLQCNKNNIESITNNFFRLFSLSFICSSFVTNLLCTFTGAIVGTLLAINFLRMNKYYITK
jgi:hypothetical protein